jgi:GAF domain
MPRFEVFVPAAPPALPLDVTLRLDADNWLAALKAGLEKLGGPGMTSNVLCDIQEDGSIHVTAPQGGGVFRIRELAAAAAPPPAAAPATAPAAPPRGRAPGAAATSAAGSAPPGRIGRAPAPRSTEDVLAELFERVGDLDPRADRKSGLAFLLDLAMEKIDCEAGSVFLSRLGGGDLEFAVARGPRAQEILKLGLTVPMGVGIVGFCAQENVCLAVSDAEKDPRFHRAVSQVIGYETRSLLCAPIAKRGSVLGALEVVNKRAGRPFEKGDLAVLSYLAHQAAELVSRSDS